MSGSEKGSLLIFSKVEIRWDSMGNVIQDTFLDISNDFPDDVQVQMYFINGDPPLAAESGAAAAMEDPAALLDWLIDQIDEVSRTTKR